MRPMSVLDICLPERCSICGEPLLFARAGRDPVCAGCTASFLPIRGKRCSVCSLPLVSENGRCMRCRKRESIIDRNVSVFLYTDLIAETVSRYKVRGQRRLSSFFAAFLHDAYRKEFPGLTVVPVPFRPASRKKRGWDQIDEIASVLEHRHSVPVLRTLSRLAGRAQKSLSYEQRLGNLTGTILWKPASAGHGRVMKNTVPPGHVVLLDDVYTTGATVNECARVLMEAGIDAVSSLTIAIDP